MDINLQSQSPDNADSRPSFRKPSNDATNRKYRRRSPANRSDSSSSGSLKHEWSPSPVFSRENPAKRSGDKQRRKDDHGDLDWDYARNRYGKSGGSHRHSARQSYGSSHDYRRHDDYRRLHRLGDEGERNYERSSRSGRESRTGIHSDHLKQESEHDRSKDRRDADKHSRDTVHRSKDKERETMVLERHKYQNKDSSSDRIASDRKSTESMMEDIMTGDRDGHNRDRGGGREDKSDHRKSHTSPFEESKGYGKDSTIVRDDCGNSRKETHKGNYKELDRQNDAVMEKRKYHDRDSGRHRERYTRELDEHFESDYRISSGYRERDKESEQDKTFHGNQDQDGSAKKSKLFNSDEYTGNVKDSSKFSTSAVAERTSSSSKQVSVTVDKTTSECTPSSAIEAEATTDLDAAKVAAMKAAELVNKNLVGGGYMSTDQKKKLLWGNKKNTVAEESGNRWDMPLFPDRERQEKFNKLMGVKGDMKLEHKPDSKDGGGLLQAEKQKELQIDLEKQYTAGLRRRDGRTVGLGL